MTGTWTFSCVNSQQFHISKIIPFLEKATSRLKIHLLVSLLTSLLRQLSGAGWISVLFILGSFSSSLGTYSSLKFLILKTTKSWSCVRLGKLLCIPDSTKSCAILNTKKLCPSQNDNPYVRLLGSFFSWWETPCFLITSKLRFKIWKVLPLKWSHY